MFGNGTSGCVIPTCTGPVAPIHAKNLPLKLIFVLVGSVQIGAPCTVKSVNATTFGIFINPLYLKVNKPFTNHITDDVVAFHTPPTICVNVDVHFLLTGPNIVSVNELTKFIVTAPITVFA